MYNSINMKKEYDPKLKVWVVIPECHSNGGWSGYRTLSFPEGITLEEALEIDNPYKVFDEYDVGWGYLSSIRICTSQNANDSIFIYDSEDYRWKRCN